MNPSNPSSAPHTISASCPDDGRYVPAQIYVLRSTAHPELWLEDATFPKADGRTTCRIVFTQELKEARRFTTFTVEAVRSQIVAAGEGDKVEVETFDEANVRTCRLYASKPN